VAFLAHLLLLWRRDRGDPDPLAAFALLSLSVPLIVPTAWPHYFVFLPFVQAWAAWKLVRAARGRVWGATILLGSVFLASVFGYRLAGDWWTYSQGGIPLVAALLLLAVVHAVGRPGRRSAAGLAEGRTLPDTSPVNG
jgi:hypothetical protein